jgi:hypothetical protein
MIVILVKALAVSWHMSLTAHRSFVQALYTRSTLTEALPALLAHYRYTLRLTTVYGKRIRELKEGNQDAGPFKEEKTERGSTWTSCRERSEGPGKSTFKLWVPIKRRTETVTWQ